MASPDDAKGRPGERGRERHVMLMHPQSAVVHGVRHFYPYGESELFCEYYLYDKRGVDIMHACMLSSF